MEEDGEKREAEAEAGALEAAAEGGGRGWAVAAGASDLPPGEVGPSAALLYIQHV